MAEESPNSIPETLDSGSGMEQGLVSMETLASLEKMTNIALSCTKHLEAVNDAMER